MYVCVCVCVFMCVRVPGGARDSDWSRPITALSPFGVIYPDGTIGPQNPENGIHENRT